MTSQIFEGKFMKFKKAGILVPKREQNDIKTGKKDMWRPVDGLLKFVLFMNKTYLCLGVGPEPFNCWSSSPSHMGMEME